ncbi:MAG: hypothetical protein HYZ29_03140 [Myxococcales bacterium]|nr:hypothetical protein [Myxococcales bacterium]
MKPFHRRFETWGTRHASAALALALLIGCSKKEAASRQASDPPPSISPVLEAGRGKGDGQLGQNIPDEGLPEGPKSFVVDEDGTLHVLDQDNERIQRFADGKLVGSTKIPARAFDDVELFGSGGYALLDVHSPAAIVFVGGDGQVTSELPLESSEIPEPSSITALVSHDDGYWVELTDDYMVHVASASGAALAASVVPGQAFDGPNALKAEQAEPQRVALFRVALPDGDTSALGEVAFGERVARRTLLAPRKGGGALLGVITESEQSDPETPPLESASLVVIDAGGHEKHRVPLPHSTSVEDSFRSVKRGNDGNVYVMKVAESGVSFVKVTP